MGENGEKHKISCAIDHIIDVQMRGKIREENVLYIVENINVAAIETTLWSMEWAIAELDNHPTVQQKIRDEISTVLKGKSVITQTPKETKVVVNAWWLANNPAWWNHPNEFRPEQFLEEDGGTEAAVAGGKVDFRYLPFGIGRRSCPEIILALPILGLVIAKLVSNFNMQAPPGEGKVDTSEKGGQFSLHFAKHSTVVFKLVAA
ncbi:Trans-cinnamate 4-monooxygenase [Capsicum chinense]|nr:Trans-cinnamate 4-monooxygenase [Capsicum chinense]